MDLNEKNVENLPEDIPPAENQPAQNAGQPCREQPPGPVNPQPPARGWVSAGPPPKEIRVGRITLGLALIAMGILLLIGLFNPGFSIMAAAKCAPVILIFIGVEILLSTFLAKGRQMKYDFLSMFVCLVLIAGSFVMALIPAVYQNVVVRERLENRVSAQLEEDCYYAAEEVGISSVHCRLYLMAGIGDEFRADMSYTEVQNLLSGQYLSIKLDENFDTAEEFCQKARQVLDLLEPLGLPAADIVICQQNGRGTLELSSRYQWDFPAEKLVNLCSGWEEDTLNVQIESPAPDEIELSFEE